MHAMLFIMKMIQTATDATYLATFDYGGMTYYVYHIHSLRYDLNVIHAETGKSTSWSITSSDIQKDSHKPAYAPEMANIVSAHKILGDMCRNMIIFQKHAEKYNKKEKWKWDRSSYFSCELAAIKNVDSYSIDSIYEMQQFCLQDQLYTARVFLNDIQFILYESQNGEVNTSKYKYMYMSEIVRCAKKLEKNTNVQSVVRIFKYSYYTYVRTSIDLLITHCKFMVKSKAVCGTNDLRYIVAMHFPRPRIGNRMDVIQCVGSAKEQTARKEELDKCMENISKTHDEVLNQQKTTTTCTKHTSTVQKKRTEPGKSVDISDAGPFCKKSRIEYAEETSTARDGTAGCTDDVCQTANQASDGCTSSVSVPSDYQPAQDGMPAISILHGSLISSMTNLLQQINLLMSSLLEMDILSDQFLDHVAGMLSNTEITYSRTPSGSTTYISEDVVRTLNETIKMLEEIEMCINEMLKYMVVKIIEYHGMVCRLNDQNA